MVAAAAGVLGALAAAGPAWAHGGDAPDGTNYRTAVTSSPAVDGLSVRAVEAGARLELDNRTGKTVEVLGYDGEPYLEVRPDGVYENVNSPATYLNETLTGGTEPPASADPTRPPSWRKVSDDPVARWHDHRTHWMSADPPPAVRADPDREQRVRDWVVPLRAGVSTMEVRGTLDWVPPPSPGVWWAMCLLVAVGVGALGLLAPARPVLGALAMVAGAVAIAYAVARELDAGAAGLGGVFQGLLLGQLWPVLTGLAALAAGAYTLARRSSADFLLALAGTCVAIFAGAANAAVFGRGVVPVTWPPTWARMAVLVVIAAGAGVAAASALRLRAAARAAVGTGRVRDMTETTRLAPGDTAPEFALQTDTGDTLTLKELRGRKVVLYAYPAAMTPGCTKQACDFRDSLASLQAAGYEVVGISPDKPAKLAKFREHDALTFPLVSDPDKAVLTAYGAYGEKQLYGKTVTGVIRSTFVIDEEGRVERAMYNVKATGHVAKLRKDLGLD